MKMNRIAIYIKNTYLYFMLLSECAYPITKKALKWCILYVWYCIFTPKDAEYLEDITKLRDADFQLLMLLTNYGVKFAVLKHNNAMRLMNE